MDENRALNEFREGVLSCNAGYFNKAYLHFETSLQYKPQKMLTRYWLAYTLYKNGYTIEANEIWQELSSKGFMSDVLSSRFELIRFRDSLSITADKIQYLEAAVIPSEVAGLRFYDKPFSLETDSRGGFYLISRGTDQILFYNANGSVVGKIIGDLIGLSRPYDIRYNYLDNLFYVSDFGRNKIFTIEKNGKISSSFGEKGIADGNFLGPQYITEDKNGYLYVSDSGNRRILKYSKDGEFILSFGSPNLFFEGFLLPTGIIAHKESLYVADQFRKKIYRFDFSGNYVETVISSGLYSPESLSYFDDGFLLLSDRKSVLSVDLRNKTTSLVTDLDGKARTIVDAELDSNGNIIISDFDLNKVFVYTDIRNLYVGLDVEIESINTFDFPNVTINTVIRDKSGNPFLGLEKENFQILQDNVPVTNFKMVHNDSQRSNVAISLIRDNKEQLNTIVEPIEKGLKDFFPSLKTDDFISVITPGEFPAVDYKKLLKNPNIEDFSQLSESLAAKDLEPSHTVFDYSVRMAVSSLINIPAKKSIIYFSTGEFPESYYKDYGLIKVADLLKNNGIVFNCIVLKNNTQVSADLKFLAEYTGGQLYHVYSPAGATRVVDDLRAKCAGRYSLQYKFDADSDFGRNYFPIDLSAFVMKRSGRGYSGFFAPVNN
ncbi:MAG: hypothetical protein JXR63_02100 [Spirochaetales bacterium]|nr:hypothetical protein [Spirochaetales bacterium]